MTLPLRTVLVALLSIVGLAACSDDPTTGGPTAADASSPVDGSTAHDASTGVDAAHPIDGSTPLPDASNGHDSGAQDADAAPDAQGAHDAAAGDGGAVDAAIDGGGLLPFASPCTQSAQCQSDLCFDFNAKGMLCTQKCQSASDCPGGQGGLGCNGMGVCKVP